VVLLSCTTRAAAAASVVREVLAEPFDRRGMILADARVRRAERRIERIGCAMAEMVLGWRSIG
jgi:hypothetical protein